MALAGAELAGILWHQGEGDTSDETLASTYGERMFVMFQRMRRDLAMPDVPVLVGELGRFMESRRGDYPFFAVVNAALNAAPKNLTRCVCVSSKDLDHKGDGLHFDAQSLRAFGHRYAYAFRRISSPKG